MTGRRHPRLSRLTGLVVRSLAALLLLPGAAPAEVLPVRAYTTLDGLPHDRVKRIREDTLGFLWFCTTEGLARFDGREFVAYGMREGLPAPSTNDLVLTPEGGAWVATNGGGIAYFEPAGTPIRFRAVPVGSGGASRVNVLHLDGSGTLWAGTDGGLFRLPRAATFAAGARFERVPLGLAGEPEESGMVWAFLESGAGLLVGTRFGLMLAGPDGSVRRVPVSPRETDTITSLARDVSGRILVGHAERGLFVLDPRSLSIVAHRGLADGLPSEAVTALLVTGRRILVGTDDGLAVLDAQGVTSYGAREGLVSPRISTIVEDRGGGVWLGTPGAGAMRVSLSGDAFFGPADGLGDIVSKVLERRDGTLVVVSTGFTLSTPEGRGFRSVRPALPPDVAPSAWRLFHGVLEDRDGAFWIATHRGLLRYPPVGRLEELSRTPPRAVYTERDGLPTSSVARLLEDGRGDVWIGTFSPAYDSLARYTRATGRFERFGARDGLPVVGTPYFLGEDAVGGVWIGYREGTLARFRDGRFTVLSGRNGFPDAPVGGFANDPKGRLWLTMQGRGLVRVDDPGAAEPRAVVYGPSEGVTSFYLTALVADAAGRIYFGTSRELKCLDPQTGAVSGVRAARGLVTLEVNCAYRDRSSGALWFGSWKGLTRLAGGAAPPTAPPAVRFAAVQVSGMSWPVPGTGATALDLGSLPHSAALSFDFFGLGLPGEPLSYEHLLQGMDRGPTPRRQGRTVSYDSLAPGRYRFLVSAVTEDGTRSAPATVAFRVRPPFWRSWWFLAVVALALAGSGWAVESVRWRQRRALDAVRARIASDLHDDLGATLSRISILAEVAVRRSREGASDREVVETIGEAARGVVERLTDGIWAVDPRRDDLQSLAERLRLAAAEMLDGGGISWRVEVPEDAARVPMRPDLRRQIYLIFKEALANVARHADARHVVLKASHADGILVVDLLDDGRGFDAGATGDGRRLTGGRGLVNMRERAAALAAQLQVSSGRGQGTRVVLRVPAGGRA